MLHDTPQIRIFEADEWPVYKALRLRSLADAPDAFGSTFSRENEFPDSKWISRLKTNPDSWDLPLLAEVDGTPIGLVWGRIDSLVPRLANLYQMWVAPGCRQLGVGRMLLEEVIAWARSKNVADIELGVTVGNSPAEHLYAQAGFKPFGQPEPLRPGSDLMCQRLRLRLRDIRL